jgi:hypothetical protein
LFLHCNIQLLNSVVLGPEVPKVRLRVPGRLRNKIFIRFGIAVVITVIVVVAEVVVAEVAPNIL